MKHRRLVRGETEPAVPVAARAPEGGEPPRVRFVPPPAAPARSDGRQDGTLSVSLALAGPPPPPRWQTLSAARRAARALAPWVSLLGHGVLLAALLLLVSATPALPPPPAEVTVGLVFAPQRPAPPATAPPTVAPAPPPPAPAPPPPPPTPEPPPPPPPPEPAPEPAVKPPPPEPRARPAPHARPEPRRRPAIRPEPAHAEPVRPEPAAPAPARGGAVAARPAVAPPPGPLRLGAVSGKCLAVYPPAMLRRGVTGRVTIRVPVAADGTPGSPSVAASSGSEQLDRAALDAVRVCRAFPRANEGYVADVPYSFELAQ